MHLCGHTAFSDELRSLFDHCVPGDKARKPVRSLFLAVQQFICRSLTNEADLLRVCLLPTVTNWTLLLRTAFVDRAPAESSVQLSWKYSSVIIVDK